MKYQLEVDINKPRSRVIELFDNPDNLSKWQPGFISFEHKTGEPGKVGSKSLLRYKHGKREMELLETITVNNLPDEFSGTYESKGCANSMVNRFIEVSSDQTKWISNVEFKLGGFMKIMAMIAPGMFKKQSYKFMTEFKSFVENENK